MAALQAELEALRNSVPGRVEEALRSHVAQLAAKQAAAVEEAEARCAQQLEQQRAAAQAAAEKAKEEVEGVTKRLEEALREGAAQAEALRRVEELEGKWGAAERRAAEAVEEVEVSRKQLEEAAGVARRHEAKLRAVMAMLGRVGVAPEALKELSDGAEAAAAAAASAAAGVAAQADQLGAGVPGAQPLVRAEGSRHALPPHLAALSKTLPDAAGSGRLQSGKGGWRQDTHRRSGRQSSATDYEAADKRSHAWRRGRRKSRVRRDRDQQQGLARDRKGQGILSEEEADSDLVWLGGVDQLRRGRHQNRAHPRRSRSAADGGYSSFGECSLGSEEEEKGRRYLGSRRWRDQQLQRDHSCSSSSSSTESHGNGTESSSSSEGGSGERVGAKHARWRRAAASEDARQLRMGGMAAMEALQWRVSQLQRAAVEARQRAGVAVQQARRGEEVLLALHGAAARAQLALAGSTRAPEQELAVRRFQTC